MSDPPSAERPALGIVIPTLEEEEALPLLLGDLRRLRVGHRVVVSDGGSGDATREVARRAGALVVESAAGRARQLNAGAAALDTPWVLFLHADSRLPPDSIRALEAWLRQAGDRDAGHFAFALQGSDAFWRFIEFGQRLRERVARLPYGDQGLVLRRRLFVEVGGYPDQPLMEDVAMVERLRARGARLRPIAAPLLTSPRRYESEGRWRGWLRNALLLGLHSLGVSPDRLAGWYPPRPRRPGRDGAPRRAASGGEDDAGGRPVAVAFARAPLAGEVKTRLAADLGPEDALRLYREMGRRVVDAVRTGAWRTVVAYTPPPGREMVVEWLGERDVEYRPQSGGDLGERMEEALAWALEDSPAACVVGTDVPALDRARVELAFSSLADADLVLGPAEDGGYYLVGVPRRHRGHLRELFRDMPWSTDRVLESTLCRAEALALTVHLLPVLRDIDVAADLEEDRPPGGGPGTPAPPSG